jgi:hypothetical protein
MAVAIYREFHKELYNGNPNVTVERVLRKRLNLEAHKLSIVQGVHYGFSSCVLCFV